MLNLGVETKSQKQQEHKKGAPMNFITALFLKIFNPRVLTTNESIVLFEENTLADAEFYQDVQAWGGNKIAADVRA